MAMVLHKEKWEEITYINVEEETKCLLLCSLQILFFLHQRGPTNKNWYIESRTWPEGLEEHVSTWPGRWVGLCLEAEASMIEALLVEYIFVSRRRNKGGAQIRIKSMHIVFVNNISPEWDLYFSEKELDE